MNLPTAPGTAGTSTRPYLIRALHDWCTDNGFTPYVAVFVDATVRVPLEYVKNNEIVLNVGFEATSGLKLGNDFIEFKARFGGASRDIQVPIDHVIAIYARENGQGMAFPVPTQAQPGADEEGVTAEANPPANKAPRLSLAGVADASAVTDDAEDALPEDESADDAYKAEVDAPEPPEPPAGGSRPTLKRIK